MKRAVLTASALALCVAAPAHAQIDEIVVTAQKKEESLQDVPVAVTALQEDVLQEFTAGAQSVLALSARAPSLYGESSFGRVFPRFYIRGYGNTDFDLNANQPVGFYLDGVVQENPALKGFPIFDVDRVEVLRGPQGTLFGRNTPAGLVKFESVRPGFEPSGYLSAAYGRFDTAEVEGAYNAPLSDTLALRVSGLFQSRDDIAENLNDANPQAGIGEIEEYAGRAQLLFEPNEAFSALLNVHGRKLDGGSQIFFANAIQPGGGLADDFDRFEYDQDALNFLELETYGGVLTVEADLGFGVLTSVSGYENLSIDSRGDVDGGSGVFDFVAGTGSSPGIIPFASETSDAVTDHGQYSQELRLAIDATEALDLTLGAFYFREELELDNVSYDTLLPGNPINGFAVQDQTTETAALFGSATLRATDRLSVIGGLRVSFEEKEFSAERLLSPLSFLGVGPLAEQSVDLDDTVVTGDLTLEYDVDADLMVYAKYARGFRAPNVQGRILFGDAITVADTETIDSFEVGTRQTFADGRGRLGVTGYYYETRDQQLTAVGGTDNFNTLINADGVQGFGLEVDLAFRPTDNTAVTVGYSLNDTEIQDDDLTIAACGAPCLVTDPLTEDSLALIDGNPLPQAPRHIWNATFQGTQPAFGGELFFLADTAYRSEVNFFLYESPEFTGDPLWETGGRVGYRTDDERLELSFWARNVFGAEEVVGAIDFNNLTAFLNEPSTYGIELTTRF
jgi:iron complex outermembrane receptor protein